MPADDLRSGLLRAAPPVPCARPGNNPSGYRSKSMRSSSLGSPLLSACLVLESSPFLYSHPVSLFSGNKLAFLRSVRNDKEPTISATIALQNLERSCYSLCLAGSQPVPARSFASRGEFL